MAKKFVEYKRDARDISVRSPYWLRFIDQHQHLNFKSHAFLKGHGLVTALINFIGHSNQELTLEEERALCLMDKFLYLLELDNLPSGRSCVMGTAEKYVIMRCGSCYSDDAVFARFSEFVLGPLLSYTRTRHGISHKLNPEIVSLMDEYETLCSKSGYAGMEKSNVLEVLFSNYMFKDKKAA